jgi:phospholipase C
MKTNAIISLLGLFGSALSAAVSKGSQEPFGYKSGSKESIANMKDKIENVVWILLENRGFDNILGGVKKIGLDNVVNNGPFWNPQNVNETNSKKWYSQYKDYDSVLHDPDHSVTGVNFELYGTYHPDNEAIANGSLTANLEGFVNRQMLAYPSISAQRATDEVMGYYSEDEIPTLVDLVDEFTTFNYWHSCVPGVSTFPGWQSIRKSDSQPAYQPQPSLCRRRYS